MKLPQSRLENQTEFLNEALTFGSSMADAFYRDSSVWGAVSKTNPQAPVFDVKTMEERIDASEATRSVVALLVTAFAAISILLATIGKNGVIYTRW